MNDDKDPIERELEKAFAVDPSPDLQARIRRRVAGIPVRPKRPLWFAPAVGLAAAAAMVFAVIALRDQAALPPSAIVPERVAAPPAASVATVVPPANDSPKESEAPRHRAPRQQETALIPTPLTLESADVSSASLEPLESALLQTFELKEQPLPAIVITPMAKLEPITIEPFNLLARETGVNE